MTANDYSIDFVDRGSATWGALDKGIKNKTYDLSILSVNETKATYDQRYVSAHGNVILWLEKTSVEYENLTMFNDRRRDQVTLGTLEIPLQAPFISESRVWAQAIDSRGWANATDLNVRWNMTTGSAALLLHH